MSAETDHPICTALHAKLKEQIDRTDLLIQAIPEANLNWTPPIERPWPAATLLGHLLECVAGSCAVLYAVNPDRLRHFESLREHPVNHQCGKDEARERLGIYRAHIEGGFALLRDEDLGRKLPTVFVNEGEAVATLLLGNLEHLINHKYQLFSYLRLMGVDVGTKDLYCFRGA